MARELKPNYTPVKITDVQMGIVKDIAAKLGGVSVSDAIRWCIVNSPDPSYKHTARRRRKPAQQVEQAEAVA